MHSNRWRPIVRGLLIFIALAFSARALNAAEPAKAVAKPAAAAAKPAATPAKPAAAAADAAKPATAPVESAKPAAPAAPRPPKALKAGKYEHLPYEDRKRDRIAVIKMLQGTEPMKEDVFNGYITRYATARWTLEQNETNLPGFRKDLRNEFLQAKTAKVHDLALKIVLGELSKLAKGNFAPVVRVNAVLAIGELNDKEPIRTESAVPAPDGLKTLVELVAEPQMIEAVKVAALVGIQRHAELKAIRNDELRSLTVAALVKILETPPPVGPDGRAADWMIGQAADALGSIGFAGPEGSVALALGRAVSTPRLSLPTRRLAARALGRLDYQSAGPFNTTPLATGLARFTLAACGHAKTEVEEKKPFSAVQRGLKTHLSAALAGLSGADSAPGVVAASKDPTHQKLAKSVQEKVQKMVAALDEKEPNAEEAMQRIESGMGELAPLVEKGA